LFVIAKFCQPPAPPLSMRITFLLLTVTSIVTTSLLAQNANEPKELVSLRDSYQKARSVALAPIDKKYVDALLSKTNWGAALNEIGLEVNA